MLEGQTDVTSVTSCPLTSNTRKHTQIHVILKRSVRGREGEGEEELHKFQ